jgi:hypothetical protein
MSHYNFNITYPIADRLLGTTRGSARAQAAAASKASP